MPKISSILLGLAATVAPLAAHDFDLKVIGQHATGIFDESAAEIPAYDAASKRLYVVNAETGIDILDIKDPTKPTAIGKVDISKWGAGVNSAAIFDHNGESILAIAVEVADTEDDSKQMPGKLVLLKASDASPIVALTVGSLPDMVAVGDGYIVTANEGEPNDAYDFDPEGSISVIAIKDDLASLTDADVKTAGFAAFEDQKDALHKKGAHFPSPEGTTLAQDMEPEYVAIADGFAYVVCQENNCIAKVDLKMAKVTDIFPLGRKDFNAKGNEIDASNKDKAINMKNWPAFGLYQPDAIVAVKGKDGVRLITANEGDARDYDGYSEEARAAKLKLDEKAFPNAAELQDSAALGRLKVTTAEGDTDGDGDYDEIVGYGGRSVSIWGTDGTMIWDSANQFETITAKELPEHFNSTNDENGSFDNRSDDKGPEPEGLAVGTIEGHDYLFVGLERVGGIMVYELSNPPKFVTYINNRDFSQEDPKKAGDLGPEGMVFIPAATSPNGKDLLVVANEVSGTTTIYEVATK